MKRRRKIIEDEELEDEIKQSKDKSLQIIVNNKGQESQTKPSQLQCPVCYEKMAQSVFLECLHKFCLSCIQSIVNHNQKLQCPLCRQDFEEYNIYKQLQSEQFQWIQYVKIDAPNIVSSEDNSELQPSYDFQSAPSIQECQKCFCNDDPDEMIRCHNCQRIIGHQYCFPNLSNEVSFCSYCIDLEF